MFSDDKPVRDLRKFSEDSRGQVDPVDRSAFTIDHLVFVGFNSQIVALDRSTGGLIWHGKSPKGRGFVAMLLDGDQLIVSVKGYTYRIDPATRGTLWTNLLNGVWVRNSLSRVDARYDARSFRSGRRIRGSSSPTKRGGPARHTRSA